jgi:hypothetical protein
MFVTLHWLRILNRNIHSPHGNVTGQSEGAVAENIQGKLCSLQEVQILGGLPEKAPALGAQEPLSDIGGSDSINSGE